MQALAMSLLAALLELHIGEGARNITGESSHSLEPLFYRIDRLDQLLWARLGWLSLFLNKGMKNTG